MKLLELELFARFRDRRDVKVLRHKDTKLDLWAMRGTREFAKYQNGQSWDVFGSARFIFSFIAERQKFGKFVGVWEVLSKKPRGKGFRYVTRELPGFKDMEGRLVVHWGKGTRSWAQWLHRAGNKVISEILPPNYVADFPGYYDFVLRSRSACPHGEQPRIQPRVVPNALFGQWYICHPGHSKRPSIHR